MSKSFCVIAIAGLMVIVSDSGLAQTRQIDTVCKGMAAEIERNLSVLASSYETRDELEREYTSILKSGKNNEQRQRLGNALDNLKADAHDRIRAVNEMKKLSSDLKCNQP